LYFEQVLLQLFLIIMGASYCAADLTIMKFHPKYFVVDVIDAYIYIYIYIYNKTLLHQSLTFQSTMMLL